MSDRCAFDECAEGECLGTCWPDDDLYRDDLLRPDHFAESGFWGTYASVKTDAVWRPIWVVATVGSLL